MIRRFKTFRKNKELFLLSLPAVLIIFVFYYIPMYGIVLPFKDYRYDLGFWKSPWVGFQNFKFLFNSDYAVRITRNTVVMNSLFIVTTTIVAIIFALMLYELTKKYVKVYQTIMLIPFFFSWVIVSYLLLGFLDMDHGLLNGLLAKFGKEAVLWYNEAALWPAILVIANIWKGVGYTAIIYYTGLLGIDSEYYEAARLDGANKLQQIWYITLPALKGLIIIMILLSVGKIFYGNFDMFYNLPLNSAALYPTTDIIDTFVYRSLRSTGDIGMASAAGLYQSIVGFVLVMVSNMLVRKFDKDSALF